MTWILVRHPALTPVGTFTNPYAASVNLDHQFADDALNTASELSAEQYIALADLCNRRQQGTCRWILESSQYQEWLLGSFRTLYCFGPRMSLSLTCGFTHANFLE